jgi:hypothetical protein
MKATNGNGAERKKESSRKWNLVLLILSIATFGAFVPPLISLLIGLEKPLFILTGGEFVTLVSLILSAYYGANVLQKYVLKDHQDSSSSTKTTTTQTTASSKGQKPKDIVHTKCNDEGTEKTINENEEGEA